MARRRVVLAGWQVDLDVDNDQHLTVYISHEDGTKPFDVGEDLGDQTEIGARFSTEGIEERFREQLEEKEA